MRAARFTRSISKKNAAPLRHRLHEDRRRSANECRHTQQITRSYIPHGDLAAVAGMHVDAKQTVHDDGQSFSVRFRIHGMAGREVDDPSAGDQ